jgi:hypothetical protein
VSTRLNLEGEVRDERQVVEKAEKRQVVESIQNEGKKFGR